METAHGPEDDAVGVGLGNLGDTLDKMGRRIADAQKEFDQLVTTRQRQLDRVLAEIDTLRHSTDYHLLGVRDLDAESPASCPAVPAESDSRFVKIPRTSP